MGLMRITISKTAWYCFIALLMLLVVQLFLIEYAAQQVGPAADSLRLSIMFTLLNGLAIMILPLFLMERSPHEPALSNHSSLHTANSEELLLRSHVIALNTVVSQSRTGKLDPAMLTLANQLQQLVEASNDS